LILNPEPDSAGTARELKRHRFVSASTPDALASTVHDVRQEGSTGENWEAIGQLGTLHFVLIK
jgi:hypothetical protein